MLRSAKQQEDYVSRTSQKLFMMRQLNSHYAAAISSKQSVMKLVKSLYDYVLPCQYMSVYNELISSKDALANVLRENKSLRTAVKAVVNYNMKAEAYQRAAFRIDSNYSNEFHHDFDAMPYKKFCRTEEKLFEQSFQLPVIHFGLFVTVSYANLTKTQKYETEIELSQQELTDIFGFDKIKFDGSPIGNLLDDPCEKNVRGCYVLYNRTLDKFYVGSSESVYEDIRSFFLEGTFKQVLKEFEAGGDFYVRIIRLDDQSSADARDMAVYLYWCYSDKDGRTVKLVNKKDRS